MKKYRCENCGEVFDGKSFLKRFFGESGKLVDPAPTLFGQLKGVMRQQCPHCGSANLRRCNA